MNRRLLAVIALALCCAATSPVQPLMGWHVEQLAQLRRAVLAAGDEGLPVLDMAALDGALRSADSASVDRAATALALKLAQMHLLGCATPAERAGWQIADSDRAVDLPARLAQALAAGDLDPFFAGLRPLHSDYAALRSGFAAESDPARRAVLARNMERWRWMPQSLGADYVLVNAASFEAGLWRKGERAGSWRVIVGKPKTPTPVFAASITGVTINPWWDVPSSIVRESVGALVRRNPALARQRGYVWGGGRYRQRPGPGNSLGQMKLAMANPYNVYLHDTPSRNLFARDVRAFSHGCIRVGDALGFAATLLDGTMGRDAVDALVASGETRTVDVPRHLPVYITYFTAGTRGDGTLAEFPDIYGRDSRMGDAGNRHWPCAG